MYYAIVFTFLYKYKFNLLPEVCKCLLTLNADNNVTYNFRNVYNFSIPSHRTSLREKCLKVRGPTYWNSIPDDLKSVGSIFVFKYRIRQLIIENIN